MASVLLTRPIEDSERLARELARFGYDGIIEPLLAIQPALTPVPDLKGLQAVLLTSVHALDFLDRQVCVTAALCGLPCFCVGSRTASAARGFGFKSVRDVAGDGLALAERAGRELKAGGGDLLHIAGRDIDSRGRDDLERRGFTLRVWTIYAAEASRALSPPTIRLFRNAKLDAVLVFSARTAATLKTLVRQHELEACCGSVIALGISDAVRRALGGLPWRRLEAALQPTEDAVLQRLKELLPVSEVP